MTETHAPEGLLVQPFDTVLVANRGEIAVRVIRSCRSAGHRTVAVYSDVDAGAPHVALADEAVHIGPAAAAGSYLDAASIIDAARATGAQAVHPGYGFLAENAGFAQACHDAGLVFIGPPPSAISLMGDKSVAKRRMEKAGVPLLPGYQGESQDDERLLEEAERIGLPLMVKAAAGGGGKGMRLVTEADALPDAIAAARREAMGAFGSDVLLLERALLQPRHVEIQVLADAHGHTIALGERDCSVQRRHQKVVEEAPSPALDQPTREAMQQAAVEAAKAVGYVGAGTVEFLFDRDDDGTPIFAFLEMNTRLQVEHPVTELVTGHDLVDWQLRVAAGDRLTIEQADVVLDGHAIEVRLYAEDPAAGYLPQTGVIQRWRPPSGPGIRVDAGIVEGQQVTANYDPMLAKLIAHGRTREEARRRLLRAVESTVLLGVRSNRGFLAEVLAHPVFAGGDATTAFLADHEIATPAPGDRELAAIAGIRHLRRQADADRRSPGLAGWSNAGRLRSTQRLVLGDEDPVEVRIEQRGGSLDVSVAAAAHVVADGPAGVTVDGRTLRMDLVEAGENRMLVRLPRADLDIRDVLLPDPLAAAAAGAGVLLAPMHGSVVAVPVSVGDEVVAGDPVLVVEAMKMEHVIAADVDGTISELAQVGAQVADGEVVARIDHDE